MGAKRILIIDDEVGLTHLLQVNLQRAGAYQVRFVNRGSEALEAAREFRPDLVLLDVVMPDMDGGQVAAELQDDAQLKHTPIVFLTAIVSKGEAKTHRGVIGGLPFLAKPVSVQDVVRCIEQYAGTHPAGTGGG